MRLSLSALAALLLAGCSAVEAVRPDGGATAETSEETLLARLPCGPRRELVDFLAGTWAQRPVAQALAVAGGLIAQTSVVEILATPDGASWTAIVTAPNGMSCVLAGGEAWQPLGGSVL